MKPHILLVVLSFVVLTGCLLVISLGVTMLTITWDPCAMIGGAMILPVAVYLGLQQYRGTFRYNSDAASTSAVILFIFGGLSLLMLVTSVYELSRDAQELPWLAFLPLLAGGLIFFGSAWMNLSWSKTIKNVVSLELEQSRLAKRDRVAALVAIACVVGLTSYFMATETRQYAEHVSRDEALWSLPAEATDISYCHGSRGIIAFEFNVDEDSFAKWVEDGIGSIESMAAKVSIKEITNPYTITLYNALSQKLSGPESITITNGLYYEWTKEDRGVYAAFDRTNGRAYYHAHYH